MGSSISIAYVLSKHTRSYNRESGGSTDRKCDDRSYYALRFTKGDWKKKKLVESRREINESNTKSVKDEE